jgi:acyl-CoA synthetase (AMP-forming)/AMP-acid ligase II
MTMRHFVNMKEAILSRRIGRDQPYVVVVDASGQESVLCQDELINEALKWSHLFAYRGVMPGDPVLLATTLNKEYVAALCGAILYGAIPCTVAAPNGQTSGGKLNGLMAAQSILSPKLIVADDYTSSHVIEHATDIEHLIYRVQEPLAFSPLSIADLADCEPSSLHHVQFTSGSTSSPKAIRLSHQSVMNNIEAISDAISFDPNGEMGVSWLPLFHDMGLVLFLMSLYHGGSIVLQATERFIRNPLSWLSLISRHKGTLSAAAPFALNYCVRRYQSRALLDVDLSTWRIACIGGDRIVMPALEEFAKTFEPHGFNRDALCPSYGMAEMVLAATMARPGAKSSGLGARVGAEFVKRIASTPGEIRSLAGDDDVPVDVVSVGPAVKGAEVTIRYGEKDVAQGCVGDIWLRGNSFMDGYWGDPVVSNTSGNDGWYFTGDIGYLMSGELYVLGRSKELIIINGSNYYPQDFEECAEGAMGVDREKCAAFGVYDDQLGSERLVLALEPHDYSALSVLRRQIQDVLRKQFGFAPSPVVFVQSGGLPRTTSRKVKRYMCKELYLNGDLPMCAELS